MGSLTRAHISLDSGSYDDLDAEGRAEEVDEEGDLNAEQPNGDNVVVSPSSVSTLRRDMGLMRVGV